MVQPTIVSNTHGSTFVNRSRFAKVMIKSQAYSFFQTHCSLLTIVYIGQTTS